MKLLAIDFGLKKLGLAIGDDMVRIAEPLEVLRAKNLSEAIEELIKVVEVEKIEKVVIGISAGKMAEETKKFGKLLKEKLNTPVIYQDETYSTIEAQSMAIASGIKRKKRRNLEDAYAATLILQSYLDSL